MTTDLFKSRAAGPVSIYRPNEAGALELVEVRAAGTIEAANLGSDHSSGRRGRPRKGEMSPSEMAARFAQSENSW